jgi:hypothetical protein
LRQKWSRGQVEARLVNERHLPAEVGAIERHVEKETVTLILGVCAPLSER